jgi:hypothetical protein
MTSELEGRAEVTAVPDAAGSAAEVTAAEAGSTGTVAQTAMPATTQPTTPATAAGNTPPPPPPQDGARVRNSLEAVKTAVVWLVVIQLLTILSPLLRVSVKWALVVGLVLTLSSFALGVLAYLKAQRAQRSLPE